MIIIHTDGGSRGNPGPAAIGIIIDKPQQPRQTLGKYLGITTNNVAEYTAVLEALTFLLANTKEGERDDIQFLLDSQLVERQLNGVYKIKDATLQTIAIKVKHKIGEWGRQVTFTHVPREQNKDADKTVNNVLDNQR